MLTIQPSRIASKHRSYRRTTMVVFLALLVSVHGISLWMIWPYLLAVTMGAILALLSHPVYRKWIQLGCSPRFASGLVTLGIIVLVIAPIAAFVTVAVKQAIAVGHAVASSEAFSFQSILNRVSDWGPVERLIGSPEVLERQSRTWIQGAAQGVTTAILALAARVPEILLQLALASLACFFFLIDGKRFLSWMKDKIPLDGDVRSKIVASFENTAISVVWATLAAAFVQSVIMLLSFLVLGVPAAFVAAGATFIFAWIPIVGSTPVWVAGTIYLFTQGAYVKAVLMVAFGLITGVADNFVRPMVLKGRSKIHPLVSLIAIFGGVGMFGIMGVFIGPIIVAIAISLLQIWPTVGTRFGILPQVEQPVAHRGQTFGSELAQAVQKRSERGR